MSVITPMDSHRPGLQQEAARWFACSLSDRFDAEGRARLDAWLAVDPAHANAFAAARNTWQELQGLQGDAELLALAAAEPLRQRWRGWAIAASVAVIAVAGTLFWQLRAPGPSLYSTESWEQRSVTLADGSTALLGKGTTVEVHIDAQGRGATVRSGEAIFEVAHDTSRPFVVTAGDASVTVTGTRFQVSREKGEVAVTLMEGAIKLARQRYGYEQRLVPGQQAAFSERSDKTEVRKVDVASVTAWSRERFVFRDTPLADALREANRHARLKLILKDASLGSIPVNGHFRLDDNESLLAALKSTLPIEADYVAENEVVLTRRKPSPP